MQLLVLFPKCAFKKKEEPSEVGFSLNSPVLQHLEHTEKMDTAGSTGKIGNAKNPNQPPYCCGIHPYIHIAPKPPNQTPTRLPLVGTIPLAVQGYYCDGSRW